MHIGNLRAAWLGDSISNVAKIAGWQSHWITNITDVGHLVDDGDDGEDKLEKGARREGKRVQDIVNFYTEDYIKQCDVIGIDLPTGIMRPKATEYIEEQIILSLELLAAGKAYLLEDGIYFDSEYNNQLFEENDLLKNHQPLKAILEIQAKQKAGQSNQYNDRDIKNITKNPGDFALWKFVSEDALQKWRIGDYTSISTPEFNSKILDLVINKDLCKRLTDSQYENLEVAWGCPGWHSECVAMICDVTEQVTNSSGENKSGFSFQNFAKKTVIDLHLGGEDHIDVHHKNEILQSEALGFHLSNYWVHNKFVVVDGKKMSKSLGNVFLIIGKYEDTGFYSLEHPPLDIQDKFKTKRFDPLAYRLLLMEHHYTTQLDFTWDKLAQSQVRLFNLRKLGARALSFAKFNGVETGGNTMATTKDQLTKILVNNLDFPTFLSEYGQFLEGCINKISTEKKIYDKDLEIVQFFDKEVSKLGIFEVSGDEVNKLANIRQRAKESKNWAEADTLRTDISKLGYQVDDYPWGYGLWYNPMLMD